MCGIVGYVGHQQAAPILLEGLARLEYRGYDSAGIALSTQDGDLFVQKRAGKIAVLRESLAEGTPAEASQLAAVALDRIAGRIDGAIGRVRTGKSG